MKLFKTENPYLSKDQWRKVFLAMSIMTIILYSIAIVFSLCGSKYFILNYQNTQMDKIEAFMRSHSIMGFITCLFLTIETSIILCFTLNKIIKIWYPIIHYAILIAVAFIFPKAPSMFYTAISIGFYVIVIWVNQLFDNHKNVLKVRFNFKRFWFEMLKLVIALAITFILQLMIYVIKAGYFSVENHVLPLSGYFIYSLEYDIALLVILYTVSLFIHREKGDSKSWAKFQDHYGSSQTSKKQSQKSLQKKVLTKTQKNKLRWLYAKVYLIQTLGFLLLMVLPFLLGKVLEFLTMYFAFAIVRYVLGFKYSLHYKKESLCIAVGVAVFGILSLAVPFFYVVMIIALTMGSGLAILLHLSYKYKGMWLFNKVSKPDKFALLYVFFDGDLSEHHVKTICKYKGLDNEQVQLIWDYVQGNKISYLAFKFNYSQRMINYKLDEAIDKLID